MLDSMVKSIIKEKFHDQLFTSQDIVDNSPKLPTLSRSTFRVSKAISRLKRNGFPVEYTGNHRNNRKIWRHRALGYDATVDRGNRSEIKELQERLTATEIINRKLKAQQQIECITCQFLKTIIEKQLETIKEIIK